MLGTATSDRPASRAARPVARFARLGCGLLLLVALGGCLARHPDPPDRSIEHGGRPAAAPADAPLTLVSFNVQHAPASALAAAIRHDALLRRADLLLLQEVECHPRDGVSCAAALGAALGMQHAYAPRYALADGGTHGLALLSRRPLFDLEVIELPRFDLGYNNGRVIALAASVRVGAETLRVYNAHLDTRITPGERIRQLRPLVERAAGRAPAVVAGDFNSTPFTWVARRVPFPGAANNARIERLMGAHGFRMTAQDVISTTRWIGLCLDWIYAKDVTLRASGVRHDVRLGDHYPVWATIAARGAGGGNQGGSLPPTPR